MNRVFSISLQFLYRDILLLWTDTGSIFINFGENLSWLMSVKDSLTHSYYFYLGKYFWIDDNYIRHIRIMRKIYLASEYLTVRLRHKNHKETQKTSGTGAIFVGLINLELPENVFTGSSQVGEVMKNCSCWHSFLNIWINFGL